MNDAKLDFSLVENAGDSLRESAKPINRGFAATTLRILILGAGVVLDMLRLLEINSYPFTIQFVNLQRLLCEE